LDSNSSLVSIILTTYNRASWLPRSIGSVLSQTYQNWELIVWNDGSIDNSEDVIRSFDDNRIRYYYEKNHGMSYALNQALKLCNGKYIAFIDDDDQWLNEKLKLQVESMDNYQNVGVLFTNFYNVNLLDGNESIGFHQYEKRFKELKVKELNENILQITKGLPEKLLLSNFILPSSTIIRRTLFEKVGGFNERLRNAMDFELWWRMSLAGATFAFTNLILVKRTKPSGSLSSPSVPTFINVLLSYNSCYAESIIYQREDLIPFLCHSNRSIWNSLLKQYIILGDKGKALQALQNSLQYGFNWRSLYLSLGLLLGNQIVTALRRKAK